jgi:hypothetical protein
LNKNNTKNYIYLLLSLLTLVTGYAFLRFAYHATDSFPFTQEIILIILGTIATIFITALLLNKQTSVEIEKEQNIRYLDLKTSTYRQLLDLIEEMSMLESFTDRDIIRLHFLPHKLSVIAAPEVIDEYHSFLNVIRGISADKSFSGDMKELHEALSNLTIKIRRDILGESQSKKYSESKIIEMIRSNAKSSVFSDID